MTAFLCMVALLGAAPLNNVFDQANAAYESGQYDEAIKTFEQLVAEGVEDPAVFYNLGNAYYQVGRLGPAMANYDRALRLHPTFESATFNRAQAQSDAKRGLQRPLDPAWQQMALFWHVSFSPRFALAAFLVVNALFWLVLLARLWKPVRYSRVAAFVLAVCLVLTGMSAWAKTHPLDIGYAAQPVVEVRYGPSDGDAVRFELYDGDAVSIEDRRDGWLRVKTIDDEQGWVSGTALAPVGPPYEKPPARYGGDPANG